MRLQNIIFPTETFEYKDMYFRGGELKNNKLVLKQGESVSFDTYFNSFSYILYRDYTTVCRISFTACFSGRAMVQLCVFDGAEHITAEYEAENEVEISVDFSDVTQKGFMYAKFIAMSDFELYDYGYYSECESRNINACIGICTYKREDFVIKNLELLRSFEFSFINRVFVSDNGNTLDCVNLSDGFITVSKNKNYGGSGGFTKCMIDAYDGGYSHIIVMDDDVVFHPEILERMTVLLSVLNSENTRLHISAAMLSLNQPFMQYEAGAKWSGKSIKHLGFNFDIRDRNKLLENVFLPVPDYGGWWCFCLPTSDIVENRLPYPFFIKFDDAEFGIRNREQGKIITMNGIAVSHEDFDRKYSSHLEYYNIRNQLVMNAVNLKHSFGLAMRRLVVSTVKHLFLYRYDDMPIVFRAFEDFLSGPEFFVAAQDDRVNSEIMAMRTKMQPLSEINGWDSDNCVKVDELRCHRLLSAVTLGGHIIPTVFMKKQIICAPIAQINIGKCVGYKSTIQFQLGSPEGIRLDRDVRKFFIWFFKTIGLAFKLCFCYSMTKKRYVSKKHEITSIEFWRKKLSM